MKTQCRTIHCQIGRNKTTGEISEAKFSNQVCQIETLVIISFNCGFDLRKLEGKKNKSDS